MSNGLKVGLLVVIAGVLGFLGYSQLNKNSNDISGREVPAGDQRQLSSVVNGTDGQSEVQPKGNTGEASQGRAKTTLKFDKVEHDFGTINQGDQVECVFKVTNTGDEPLVIEDAKGSCGCTVPEYPKEPIPKGETRDIKVKFNSAGKSKLNQKTVTLTANTEPINTTLTIKSFVNAPENNEKKEAH